MDNSVNRHVSEHGVISYRLNDSITGAYHRVDGPAVIHPDGTETWWYFGARHRTDGPAITLPSGEKSWYLYGTEYEPMAWLLKVFEMGLK